MLKPLLSILQKKEAEVATAVHHDDMCANALVMGLHPHIWFMCVSYICMMTSMCILSFSHLLTEWRFFGTNVVEIYKGWMKGNISNNISNQQMQY